MIKGSLMLVSLWRYWFHNLDVDVCCDVISHELCWCRYQKCLCNHSSGLSAGAACSNTTTDNKQCVDNAQCLADSTGNNTYTCQCGDAYYNNNGNCTNRTYNYYYVTVVHVHHFPQLWRQGNSTFWGLSVLWDDSGPSRGGCLYSD